MISVQDLGLSIMSDSPKSIYILGGSEYGIKDKYIDKLTALYGKKEEYNSVSDVINLFSVKHLFKLDPAVYVVRYDEAFVSSISPELATKLKRLNINGTLICLYTESKHLDKIDKYLPDYTAVIEPVNLKFVEKYLHTDFPKLDDRSIRVAAKYGSSYGHARAICKSMIATRPENLAKMKEDEVARLFGCSSYSNESDLRKAIASRNFVSATKLLDEFEGDESNLVYTILQTMIDMEKILVSKHVDSDLNEYAKVWKLEDVYNMFMNTYAELNKLRSNTSTDIRSSLIYLFALLTFKDIPSVEVMNAI